LSVAQLPAAVDRQYDTRDEPGFIAAQKNRSVGTIIGSAWTGTERLL
jgi:hypothetical protein